MKQIVLVSILLMASTAACVRDANSAGAARTGRDTSGDGDSASTRLQGSAVVARRLWVAGGSSAVDIASDGRTVLIDSAGGLQLRDIVSGVSRVLVSSDSGWVVTARLSRDGSRVYYARAVPSPTWDTLELRVREIATSKDRLVRAFAGRHSYVEFGDESHDGDKLVLAVRASDWTWQLATTSLIDGRFTPIKSFKWRSPGAPRVSPDGRFIAYDVSPDERSNKRDVYVLAIDGSREAQITRTRENERLVSWAADGSGMIFTRDQGGSRDLMHVAISHDARSGEERFVRRDMVGTTMLRSVNGRLYYLVSNQPREIVSVPVSDTGVTSAAPPPPLFRALHWFASAVSPDGAQLAYFVAGENDGNGPVSLFVRSTASGDERELELPLDYIWELEWTRRSQELLAVAQKRGRDELYRIDLRTASATLITNGTAPCGGTPIRLLPLVAPNGQHTYYLRQYVTGSDAELVACPAGGGAGQVLVRGALLPPAYALSPDGEQIAVIEHRPDTSVVHVVPTASGVPRTTRRFVGTEQFNGIGGWTADGRHLLLTRRVGERGSEMWQLPLSGEAKPSLKFRTDHGGRARYVPALKRALYTVVQTGPDELWVLERRPVDGMASPNAP